MCAAISDSLIDPSRSKTRRVDKCYERNSIHLHRKRRFSLCMGSMSLFLCKKTKKSAFLCRKRSALWHNWGGLPSPAQLKKFLLCKKKGLLLLRKKKPSFLRHKGIRHSSCALASLEHYRATALLGTRVHSDLSLQGIEH